MIAFMNTKTITENQFLMFIFLTGIFVFTFCHDAQAGTDHKFESQKIELINSVKFLLIGENICKTEIECSNNETFFIRPTAWGLDIELYHAPSNFTQSVLDICSRIFIKSNGKISVRVKVFSDTHFEHLYKYFWNNSPQLEINFKRE